MFRLAAQTTNLVLTATTLVTSEILNAKIKKLQKDLNEIKDKLDSLNFDVLKGVAFFEDIAIVAHNLEWKTSTVDTYVSSVLNPKIQQLITDSDTLFSALKNVPTTSSLYSNTSTWQGLVWVTRVKTIVTMIWGGISLYDGLFKFWQKRQEALTKIKVPAELKPLQDQIKVNADKIPEEPKIKSAVEPAVSNVAATKGPATVEQKTPLQIHTERMDKLGKTFDSLAFIVNVVTIVFTIMNYKGTQEHLSKMIDDVEKSVADAKVQVAELEAASVSFFRDLPSTFLLIRAQLNQTIQIALAAKLVQTSQATNDDAISESIIEACSLFPFTDAQLTYMAEVVDQLNAVETDSSLSDETKTTQYNTIWTSVETQIPQQTFIDAFIKTPTLYEKLTTILELSYSNFEFVADMVTAIQLVRSYVPGDTQPPLSTLANVIKSVLGFSTVSTSVPLAIIALYSDFTGDTYETTNDCKTIRENNSSVSQDAWSTYLSQLVEDNTDTTTTSSV